VGRFFGLCLIFGMQRSAVKLHVHAFKLSETDASRIAAAGFAIVL
jgi:hypothetical protein